MGSAQALGSQVDWSEDERQYHRNHAERQNDETENRGCGAAESGAVVDPVVQGPPGVGGPAPAARRPQSEALTDSAFG